MPPDANLDAMSVIAASLGASTGRLPTYSQPRQFRTLPLRGQSPEADLPTANHRGVADLRGLSPTLRAYAILSGRSARPRCPIRRSQDFQAVAVAAGADRARGDRAPADREPDRDAAGHCCAAGARRQGCDRRRRHRPQRPVVHAQARRRHHQDRQDVHRLARHRPQLQHHHRDADRPGAEHADGRDCGRRARASSRCCICASSASARRRASCSAPPLPCSAFLQLVETIDPLKAGALPPTSRPA